MLTDEIIKMLDKTNNKIVIHPFITHVSEKEIIINPINKIPQSLENLNFDTVKEECYNCIYYITEKKTKKTILRTRVPVTVCKKYLIEKVEEEDIDPFCFPNLDEYYDENIYKELKKKITQNLNVVIKKENDNLYMHFEVSSTKLPIDKLSNINSLILQMCQDTKN